MKETSKKLISLEEAAALVPDGANISFGGFAETNNPLSFVRQMIRAGKKHLEISGMGDAQSVELLCGVGAVDLVRVSNYMAKNGRCPNFCRCVEQGTIRTEDYSHFGITNRFFAAAMGLPFMPVKVMIGSDLCEVQNFDKGKKVMEFDDPFSGERCGIVPKLAPDFAVIHVARADAEGNCQLYGITSSIEIIARARKRFGGQIILPSCPPSLRIMWCTAPSALTPEAFSPTTITIWSIWTSSPAPAKAPIP